MSLKDMLSVREQVINEIMDADQAGHVINAMRGMAVGLIASEEKYLVSTLGTSFIHKYIVRLEAFVANAKHIVPEIEHEEGQPELVQVPCDRCMGTGLVHAGGVRSIKLKCCPVCHGAKHLLKEKEEND